MPCLSMMSAEADVQVGQGSQRPTSEAFKNGFLFERGAESFSVRSGGCGLNPGSEVDVANGLFGSRN